MDKQTLMQINSLPELRRSLKGGLFGKGKILDEELFIHIATLCDGYWKHSGNPKQQPHVLLTSGLHSNGFLSGPKYLQYPEIAEFLARDTINSAPRLNPWPTCVVGSAYTAITFSWEVARLLGARHIHTEKEGEGQALNRFEIFPDDCVLRVEDLVTTTKTVKQVTDALMKNCPRGASNFLPAVLTLVHRSEETEVDGAPIYYGVHLDIENFAPAECPLCKAGSEAIRPRSSPEAWARLTGKTT